MAVDRTLEDFVEDMVSNGRTPREVRAIASGCRWKERKYEAFMLAEQLWAKLGKGKKKGGIHGRRIRARKKG